MKLKLFLFLYVVAGAAYGQFVTNTGIEIHNSGTVSTNGEWFNDASSNITNHGTIILQNSFTNEGTLDETSTGGFVLEYNDLYTFTPGGNRFGFLVKNGSSDADLALNGELALNDSLILSSGILRVIAIPGSPEVPVLRIDAGRKVVASPASYVEGLMAGGGSGTQFFPFGIDGEYLPLTLHKLDADRVEAQVGFAPDGYSPGPGVDSLINFPYVWTVAKTLAEDTSAYVEVNYANTLPKGANPIIVREIDGQRYVSMGARLTTDQGGRVSVRSYSRRLEGTFTVANGFPVDLVTDSLALVALYNATGGAEWSNNTNWLTGEVGSWFGVTLNGQSITALELPSNNLAGDVPDFVVDIQALETVDLSGNAITAIPDFTANTEITELNVSGNRLDFGSLEPNASVPGLQYGDQGVLGEPIENLLPVGSPYEFTIDAGGNNSQYVWTRNGETLPDATTNTISIPSLNRSTMGTFVTEVTNPLLPGLTLTSAPHRALAYATVSGQLYIDADSPAEAGRVTLFRITSAAYDTLEPVAVNANGAFEFEKVVLDDYQLLGFADTLVHNDVLPTWYSSTLLWEEADTIRLEDNLSSLDIISYSEPEPSTGQGIIDGILEEDDGTNPGSGRLEKIKRVSGAAVMARRVESSGRGKEEVLILVGYVFTNDQGEFRLPNLPPGTYRLNIQYPGYPMDETSFTTITIGNALESHVTVAATVQEGKINVRRMIVTGIPYDERHGIEVWPNPATVQLHVKFDVAHPLRKMTILDGSGRAIRSVEAKEIEIDLSVQDLPPGMYLLKIDDGSSTRTAKLFIE